MTKLSGSHQKYKTKTTFGFNIVFMIKSNQILFIYAETLHEINQHYKGLHLFIIDEKIKGFPLKEGI